MAWHALVQLYSIENMLQGTVIFSPRFQKKWRNFPGALTKFASLAVFDGSALHPAGIFFGRSAISPRKLMLKKSSHLWSSRELHAALQKLPHLIQPWSHMLQMCCFVGATRKKKDRKCSHDFLKSTVDSYMTINSFSLNEWWMYLLQNPKLPTEMTEYPLLLWTAGIACSTPLRYFLGGKFWKGKGPQQQLHLVIWCNSSHQQGASWTLRLGDVKFECPEWIFVDHASLDESNW